MRNQELLAEILKSLYRNYKQILEIEKLTKELGDTLSKDDRESAQLILNMRQEEMDNASETKYAVQVLLQAADAETRLYAEQLLQGDCPADASFEEQKISQLSRQIANSLNSAIAIDRRVNSRLAGKDSFYAEK